MFTLREIARITECSADSILGIAPWRKLLSPGSVDEQLYQAILSLDMEEKIHLLDEIQKNIQKMPYNTKTQKAATPPGNSLLF